MHTCTVYDVVCIRSLAHSVFRFNSDCEFDLHSELTLTVVSIKIKSCYQFYLAICSFRSDVFIIELNSIAFVLRLIFCHISLMWLKWFEFYAVLVGVHQMCILLSVCAQQQNHLTWCICVGASYVFKFIIKWAQEHITYSGLWSS